MTEDTKTYSICSECNQVNRMTSSFTAARLGDKLPICGKCRATLHLHDGVTELNSSGIVSLSEKIPLPLVVDFWASWCQPCHALAPSFKQAAHDRVGKVVFAKLNVEKNPLAADHYQIRAVPTLIFFERGQELARQSSALRLDQLLSWIDQVARSRRAA